MCTQDIYLKYTAPSDDDGPDIAMYKNDSCTEKWTDQNPITVTDSTDFVLQCCGERIFDFYAISFWGDGLNASVNAPGNTDPEGELHSNVARTFIKGKDGVASFLTREYVTMIDAHKKDQITFTITNQNLPNVDEQGHISLQVTILDKKAHGPGKPAHFTSRDPHIELPKKPT